MVTIDQLKELSQRVERLERYLQIDKKKIEIANEEEKTLAPDFWDNPKEAQLLVQKIPKKMGYRLRKSCGNGRRTPNHAGVL